jgi:hypothetical protein
MVGVIDALQKIVELIPAGAKVIPGHGAQPSMSDVRHSLQVLEGMQNAIQRPVRRYTCTSNAARRRSRSRLRQRPQEILGPRAAMPWLQPFLHCPCQCNPRR